MCKYQLIKQISEEEREYNAARVDKLKQERWQETLKLARESERQADGRRNGSRSRNTWKREPIEKPDAMDGYMTLYEAAAEIECSFFSLRNTMIKNTANIPFVRHDNKTYLSNDTVEKLKKNYATSQRGQRRFFL